MARHHLTVEKKIFEASLEHKGGSASPGDKKWLRAGHVPTSLFTPIRRQAIFCALGNDMVVHGGTGRRVVRGSSYLHNLGIIWA